METTTDRSADMAIAPVRKSIVVKATVERAFNVFTEDFDSWWPRSHHIGKTPMKKAIIESRLGGRCYSQHEDGTDCDWGTVTAWDPPRRFVMAWQIHGEWGYEPDLAKSSEVEVRFTKEQDGRTRIDLEHRYLERHGSGGAAVRTSVDSPNGWSMIMSLLAARLDKEL